MPKMEQTEKVITSQHAFDASFILEKCNLWNTGIISIVSIVIHYEKVILTTLARHVQYGRQQSSGAELFL